ncbi:MAG: VapD family protein [Oscillospiraceae bacterium]
MERKSLKAINYDLKSEKLKEFYPGKNHKKAWQDLKKFLLENGFKSRQWSGCVSKKAMTDAEIYTLIENSANKFPWLSKCTEKFDVTNVGRNFDLTPLLKAQSLVAEISHSAPDKTDTMEYYEAEIAKRQKQRQQLPHGEDIAIEKPKQDKER